MVAADPRLEALADGVRVADAAGRLDLEATARQLDVPIRDADIGGLVEAVIIDGVIVLNERLPSPGSRRFAFAHEAAHLLMARGAMPWVTGRSEELWADWFAHELVFPLRWLRERRWQQLQFFDDPAERRTIAMHLASSAAGATVIRVDDVVMCGRCGDRPLISDCECASYRTDAHAFESLSAMRLTSELDLNQLRLFEQDDDDPFEALWRHLIVSRLES